jgi:hypothetical protein
MELDNLLIGEIKHRHEWGGEAWIYVELPGREPCIVVLQNPHAIGGNGNRYHVLTAPDGTKLSGEIEKDKNHYGETPSYIFPPEWEQCRRFYSVGVHHGQIGDKIYALTEDITNHKMLLKAGYPKSLMELSFLK